MPNEYSIRVHNYISAEIDAYEQKCASAQLSGDENGLAYSQGQLRELRWLREYLAENIDLKNFIYY